MAWPQPPAQTTTFGQPPPQSFAQPPAQGGLREADALAELSVLAETMVPHSSNSVYRLKRVFVDSGEKRDRSDIPTLSAYEHIHVAHEAQRLGIEDTNWLPATAVGFSGLKLRYDAQQKAIHEQEAMIKTMKARLENECSSYKRSCTERWEKCQRLARDAETQLLALFEVLEEHRVCKATSLGGKGSYRSSVGQVTDGVHKVRKKSRESSLKSRVMKVDQDVAARESEPVLKPAAGISKSAGKNRVLFKQSREMLQSARDIIANGKRSTDVMRKQT